MPDLGFICVGSFLIILAGIIWLFTLSFLLRSKPAEGTVIGHASRKGKGAGTYAPIVQFQASDGQTVEFTDKVYNSPLVLIEGYKVKVAYDPNNPQRARINKFSTLHLTPVILIGVGILIILSGLPGFKEPVMNFLRSLEKISGMLP